MQKLQSPLTGDHNLRPKSGRRPLQPKNSPANPVTEIQILKHKPKPKPKNEQIENSLDGESNKENHPIFETTPTKLLMEPLDASLAEELSAIRKKLERLRLDRERTEKMLNEREKILDLHMKDLVQRGEIQKRFEIEVDRLYRLKELQSSSSSFSMRISPMRSLREKEHEKKISHANWPEMKDEDMEESVSGSGLQMQSPCSSSSSSSNSVSSSQIVAVK